MKQRFTPPAVGLVLEVGSGDNPNPRSDILVDRFLIDNIERGGNLVRDKRPLVVADAHYLPFRNDAFAYTICSHILEHMDDPILFADELMRVAHGGYIGCPSEIAERLFHWSFHRWYVNRVGDTIVLHPKEPTEPFGELFDYLYAYNPAYYFFQRSMAHLFWVDLEWQGSLTLHIADASPLHLNDPQTLHALTTPQLSVPKLIALFALALVTHLFGTRTRRVVMRLLGRNYS